jgi:hypothetical protein
MSTNIPTQEHHTAEDMGQAHRSASSLNKARVFKLATSQYDQPAEDTRINAAYLDALGRFFPQRIYKAVAFDTFDHRCQHSHRFGLAIVEDTYRHL